MSDEIGVLTETFFVSNESCVFTFDGCTLQWRGNSVNVRNFIIVDYVHSGNCCSRDKSKLFLFRKPAHTCKGHDTMIVQYASSPKKNKLKLCSVKIRGEGEILCEWLRAMRCALEKVACNRPKNWLVFINPFAGRQNGVEIYNRKVKPLFDLAKLETCVVVTKDRGDFDKIICSGVDDYDSILAVGGDGTVSEIVNCLISSQMDDAVPTMDDANACVPKISIPIAIIPCGSTDCVAYTLNRTRDTETNALYAILGYQSGFDVCRAVSKNGLNRFFVSVFTYGYLSDLIRESEKFRWMGPMRYNYAGLLTLVRSKEYYGQLDLTGEQCTKERCPEKKPVRCKSKTLSMCAIPVVPTVEPGSECVRGTMICKPKPKRSCKEITRKVNVELECVEVLAEKPKCGEPEPPPCEEPADKDEPPEGQCDGSEKVGEEATPACTCNEATAKEGEGGDVAGDAPEEAAGDGCPEEPPPECDAAGTSEPPDGDGDECEQYESAEEQEEEKAPCKEVIPKDCTCGGVVPAGEEPPPCGEAGQKMCIKGRYFLIACANISCSSELTPNGIAPNCVAGDGSMNVVLFQPNSICDLYKIYTRLTSKESSLLLSDLPFVTIYKTKHVRIAVMQKDVDKENSANCDGELFHDSIVDIRLYEGVARFIRRPPGQSE